MTRPLHVLLIEDNPADVELIRDTLEDTKLRLDLAVATDGEDALRFLKREAPHADALPPDVILLDLNLPLKDGREVLAEIKRHDELQAIPVVVLTSSDAEKDIVQSYKLGANCYVTKPVDLKAFQTIVRTVEGFWFAVVKLPPR